MNMPNIDGKCHAGPLRVNLANSRPLFESKTGLKLDKPKPYDMYNTYLPI
jgi:hypothetical protein